MGAVKRIPHVSPIICKQQFRRDRFRLVVCVVLGQTWGQPEFPTYRLIPGFRLTAQSGHPNVRIICDFSSV